MVDEKFIRHLKQMRDGVQTTSAMSSLFNSPWTSDLSLVTQQALPAPFDYMHQVELVLKIFKTFKLEVCTLFLTLDMLRRVSVEVRH